MIPVQPFFNLYWCFKIVDHLASVYDINIDYVSLSPLLFQCIVHKGKLLQKE